MDYAVVERDSLRYILCDSAESRLQTEQDALQLISACFENDAELLMLHLDVLSDEFFRLRTGLAGEVLQKLINYHIKLAVVLPDEQRMLGRFRELVAEANQGSEFRVFSDIAGAESWFRSFGSQE